MDLSYRTEQSAKAISAFWGKPINKEPAHNINALSGETTEIFIFDVLGFPFNDINEIVKDIHGIKSEEIRLMLSSPGGDVIDCFALYQALKNHKAKVTIRIEALAASAAGIVAMAGDIVEAYSTSLFMMHNAWAFTAGNQYELIALSNVLKKIDSSMVDIYHAKSNLGKREIIAMMKEETWFNAKEANGNGLVDKIIETGKPVNANFDLSVFANCPDEFKAKPKIEEPNIRNIEALLRDVGGLSKDKAKAVLARGWKAIGGKDIAGIKEIAGQTLNKFQKKD